jgi:hypothetical protein
VALGAHEKVKIVEDSIRMESLSCFMVGNYYLLLMISILAS